MFGESTQRQLGNSFDTYVWYTISGWFIHSFIYPFLWQLTDTIGPVQRKKISRGLPTNRVTNIHRDETDISEANTWRGLWFQVKV